MINLGKLKEEKDLRSVWPHEALDFTPWLAEEENLAMLSDAVGLEITLEETESGVGDFNVDIFAQETGTDRKIIIENQLEDTNHDHLGKLITYASGKEADIIIWIVKHAREEHRSAIEWLNNHTDEHIGFFLLEIKLYRIGDSEPAVKFDVIEKPNDWTKEIKKQAAASPNHQERLEYWTAFNDYAFSNAAYAKAFKKRKASTDHWMSLSLGSSAYQIGLLQERKRDAIAVEFYINEDKSIYQTLFSHKEEIETAMGFSLEWRELPEKKASRIIAEQAANFGSKDEYPTQFDWLMDTSLKIKKVFKKYL